MPCKSLAHHTQVANLQNISNKYPKPTAKEEKKEETLETHASDHSQDSCINTASHNVIFDGNLEFLNMVGVLRGSALVEDEDEDSESEVESDDEEGGTHEIREPFALEQFSLMLQRAHDVALEAECEHKRGNKWLKKYVGNSQ
jgi:hypothetical protein